MTAPAAIHELVEKFEQHRKEYQQHKNETELRREFLDPFFEALGWDVFNRKSYSERYKEVMHESSVEVEGQAKAADYAFRAGERLIFFVEAKKPSVNIETNPVPAFQLRRYGWSAKLPINILTDFEQLAVYDCRAKPDKGDKVSLGRVKLYHYSEYVEKWDEIAGLFGREAVLRGALEQFVEGQKGKKGTTEVDDAFLEEIERWRDLLARNLALRNSSLNVRELNYAVQMTIDRIVFLRICEDRGIEPDEQLHEIATLTLPSPKLDWASSNLGEGGRRPGGGIYANLLALFKRADTKYNSGLFHFAEDTLTLALQIDDKVLKDILHNLYYPESPYVFSYISADILGQVYERFLGKVIRLTAGHQAKVEEKPEVRKAGGVYYTPTYIVDYIVKNTIGKLVEGKTPENVTKLKFVDPACGSGSFLLGAYQYLLDWHLQWYTTNEPAKWARGSRPAIVQVNPSGPTPTALKGTSPKFDEPQSNLGEAGRGWRLTTEEKKRILLDNIHGVDIDAQAVEVTKLSLLLKVLEGASGQLRLGLERVLPDLSRNIQCGNSLIGPDYYDGRQMPMFGDDEFYRVNVFDWQKAFPAVFAAGGFDAVVGNPPYIRIQALQEWAPTEVEFYKQKYIAASKGNYDIYVIFVEKGLAVLNKNGRLGFILPSKFFATDYGESLRNLISERKALDRVVDFGHLQIFEQASTYTCLLFLSGLPLSIFGYAKVTEPEALLGAEFRETQNNLMGSPWVFASETSKNLSEKIATGSKPLSDLPCRIGRGSSSGSDPIFILRKNGNSYLSKEGEIVDIEPEILRIPIYATDFGRYEFHPIEKEVIIFPYRVDSNGYELIYEVEFKQMYPKAYKYLVSRKKELEQRKQFKDWFSFSAPRNLDVHETAQILVPLLADRGLYCRLSENSSQYCLMASGGFSITVGKECELSPNYVLGLLNSSNSKSEIEEVLERFRALLP